MLLPIRCDAPVYHWPVATVALIVANVLVFFGMASGAIDPSSGWMLEYGTGLHAHQWLLSIFTHLDFGHLFGNMVFLWVFGLVTEGKLGWRRFLPCYFLIGVGQSAVEQALFSGASHEGEFSMGASAAIYGLLAMSCVWAPKNNVTIFVWVIFFITTFDLSVGALAAIYIGLDLLTLVGVNFLLFAFSGETTFALSPVLHLMGAVAGAAVGVALFKRGKVDCENWDIFSVLNGTYGPYAKKETKELSGEQKQEREQTQSVDAKRLFVALLESKQSVKALGVKQKMDALNRPMQIGRKEFLALIVGLHQERQWAESAPVMAEFIRLFPEHSEAVRLKLAHICLVELERPAKAMEFLEDVELAELNAQEKQMYKKLRAVAKRKVEEGVLELDDGKL